MQITRREGFSSAPIASGVSRPASVRRARGGQTSTPTFRELAASLSQQVRTYNTTGRIQDLREQVASGSYRPDARETAARMLLMAEGE